MLHQNLFFSPESPLREETLSALVLPVVFGSVGVEAPASLGLPLSLLGSKKLPSRAPGGWDVRASEAQLRSDCFVTVVSDQTSER